MKYKSIFIFCNLVSSIFSFVSTAQTNTWDGSTDSDWHKACNWSLSAVPTTSHNVVIPSVTNKPVISAQACANAITVVTSGDLEIQPAGHLQIDGTCTPTSSAGCGTWGVGVEMDGGAFCCCSAGAFGGEQFGPCTVGEVDNYPVAAGVCGDCGVGQCYVRYQKTCN